MKQRRVSGKLHPVLRSRDISNKTLFLLLILIIVISLFNALIYFSAVQKTPPAPSTPTLRSEASSQATGAVSIQILPPPDREQTPQNQPWE